MNFLKALGREQNVDIGSPNSQPWHTLQGLSDAPQGKCSKAQCLRHKRVIQTSTGQITCDSRDEYYHEHLLHVRVRWVDLKCKVNSD
jgi:hypothetical protein